MTKRRLSSHEVEVLTQFENAAMLRDLEHSPGWMVYRQLATARIQDIRDKYENTNMDKDATWASKVSLQAIRQYQAAMEETVEQAKDLLEPDVMKRLIDSVNINEDLIEGEVGLREL